MLMSLSTVVVTGYVGQISLAQMAFAGVAGFTAIEVADNGLPFPLAVLVAVTVATLVGVAVGVPALRVRGMSLAVATMALAVAVEALVLGSDSLSGGVGGRSAPRPYLFGIDVGISAPGAANFRPAFGLTVLATVMVAGWVVANLRRNRTGLRWLALRANERSAAAAGIDVARATGLSHVLGATGSTSEAAANALYDLPETALLDMGDFAGGLLKYLRDHPVDRLTIAGGFAKLTKLAQGALDLHSARSQVDNTFLADIAAEAGADTAMQKRIQDANTALEALEMTREAGIDLAAPVAAKAREAALAVLRGAPVAVEIIVTDREGEILARTGFV